MTAIPLKGDRSAHDVDNYPERHASDLENNLPTHHVPLGSADGDIIVWDDYTGAWVVAQPSATGSLDDLDDVVAPTPDDGDLLTYDSYSGTWVPTAPTSPITGLDDIPDVDVPAPNDGDNLVYDSYSGTWISSAQQSVGQYRQFVTIDDGSGGWEFVSSPGGAEPVFVLTDLE